MSKWLVLLMVLFPVFAGAQADPTSAESYFNQGSATFIREEPEKALAIVNEGLALHPDNEPLLKLKALLEQQQKQNQQDQQNQQNQQDQKDQQDQQQQQQDKSQQDQQQDQQDKEEEKQKDEEEKEKKPPQEPQQSEEEQPPQDEQPSPGEMTEEEAEMVLDSLRQLEQAQREQMTREMIRQKMRDMPPVEKDW